MAQAKQKTSREAGWKLQPSRTLQPMDPDAAASEISDLIEIAHEEGLARLEAGLAEGGDARTVLDALVELPEFNRIRA